MYEKNDPELKEKYEALKEALKNAVKEKRTETGRRV